MQAMYILWLRQIKRQYRNKARIFGSLGQPVLLLVALGFGLGPIFSKAGQGNYIDFLAPGVVAMSIMFSAMFSGIELIFDRQFGFLKETMVAPVARTYIILGRILGGATIASVQGIIVILIALCLGFRFHSFGGLVLSLVFMALIAILFTSLGSAVGSVLDDMQSFQLIINFLIQPMFFLSGALFPLTTLPGAIKVVSAIDPLSYGVDGVRGALSGVHYFSYGLDFAVLVVISVILLAAGSIAFSRTEA